MSVTKRIATGDYTITTDTTANVNINAGNVVVTGNLSTTGVGQTTYSFISSNTSTISNTFSNLGLSFTAALNATYKVQAKIIFQHSTASTDTHSWAMRFDAGSFNYLIQQQTSNVSVYTQAFRTGNIGASTATTAQAGYDRFCDIEGIFTSGNNTPVNVQFATSSGNLTVRPNSYLSVVRIS